MSKLRLSAVVGMAMLGLLATMASGEDVDAPEGRHRKEMRDHGRMGRGPLAFLNLTDEQKAEAKKIMDAAHAEAKDAEDHEARRKIIRAAHEKVRKDVLTDEQRKKLAEHRPMGPVPYGKLTDKQKARVDEVLKGLASKLADAKTPEKRLAIFRETQRRVFQCIHGDRKPPKGGRPRHGKDKADRPAE